MKATAYSYLKTKYGTKIVKKVFKILELDKTLPMPIDNVRMSGKTTIALLEVWLSNKVFNIGTEAIHVHNGTTYRTILGPSKDKSMVMEFANGSKSSLFVKLYYDMSKELKTCKLQSLKDK